MQPRPGSLASPGNLPASAEIKARTASLQAGRLAGLLVHPLEGTPLRIVKGKFAGRSLTSPNDFRVRPTAEHVRVALLSMVHDDLANARVLDLFAGTGALGLEAISRGAKSADFVETRPASLHALKANVAALRGVKDCTRIFKRDALPFAAALVTDSYDITFLDPPYGSKMLDRVLESWMATKFSRVLAIEHVASHELPRPFDKRIIEDSAVSVYRA